VTNGDFSDGLILAGGVKTIFIDSTNFLVVSPSTVVYFYRETDIPPNDLRIQIREQTTNNSQSIGINNNSTLFTLNFTEINRIRLLNLNTVDSIFISNIHAINLTALGITATKEQLDFWYSVWQQNHKLGMRVHRASGNDIPLAVLDGQTLNEVFRDGNLSTNPNFENGTTGYVPTSSTLSIVNDRLRVTSNGTATSINVRFDSNLPSFTTPDVIYYNSGFRLNFLSNTFYLRTAFGTGDFAETDTLFTISNINNTYYYSALRNVTVNGKPFHYFIMSDPTTIPNDKYFEVSYINAYNLTALNLTSLTQSQLDYLFNIWQYNNQNALISRQFIQEA
jgi:hypothetical protein